MQPELFLSQSAPVGYSSKPLSLRLYGHTIELVAHAFFLYTCCRRHHIFTTIIECVQSMVVCVSLQTLKV